MSAEDLDCTREELLDRLALRRDGKLTRAAILLFHRQPEKWCSTCYSRIAFFSNDVDIRFQDEIYGSLLIQSERIVELLWLKYMIAPITYQGMTRVDNYPYSKDAVRELVYNALMHQDFVNGGPIQISVHPGRMYIANSGGLPPGWTVDTLMGKHSSKARNDLIAGVFFRAGLVEKWGRGIEKVCRNCRDYGNPPPVYVTYPGDVMVRLDAVSPQDAPQSTLPVNADTLPVATPVTLPVNADILPVTLPVVNSLLGRLLQVLDHETGMAELLKLLNKKNRLDVRERYIAPAMKYGYIEYTIPSKPNSRLQKYRLTAKGQELRAQMATEGLGTEGNGDSN